MLLDSFQRRLLEILFDGKPEAVGNLDSAVARYRADRAKERERLTVPAAPDQVAKLAPHYCNKALGDIDVIGHPCRRPVAFVRHAEGPSRRYVPWHLRDLVGLDFPITVNTEIIIPDQAEMIKHYKGRLKKMQAAQRDSHGNTPYNWSRTSNTKSAVRPSVPPRRSSSHAK